MAESKKAPTTRRVTGQKRGQGTAKGGTRTARGKAPEKAAETKARDAQAKQLEPVTLITGRGGFQLKVGGPLPDGSYEQPWDLTFGSRGFIEADAETVAAVEKVLAGEWSDRSVQGKDFQRNARTARLAIIRHGLETPPIPSWERLASDSRVDVALQSGLLDTQEKVAKAIRYEKQSKERTSQLPPDQRREEDPVTLAKLEALLTAQRAGVQVAGVNANIGAAASTDNASPLQVGRTEL